MWPQLPFPRVRRDVVLQAAVGPEEVPVVEDVAAVLATDHARVGQLSVLTQASTVIRSPF
jgi:hypothetical protein